MRSLASYLLLLVILAAFAALLVWPIYRVVEVGFVGIAPRDAAGNAGQTHFTLGYVQAVFLDPDLRRGLLNSAFIAVCGTLTCMLSSIPLAVPAVPYHFPGKSPATRHAPGP